MVASSGIPSKLRRLRRLRKTIIQETYVDLWKDVWFYPSCMGVRGWEGTQDIMFVGLNPSTGRFPSKDDKFLYSQLMEHHFEAAHLTDLIKLRATGQEAQAWYKAITKNQIEEEEQFKLLWATTGLFAGGSGHIIPAVSGGRGEKLRPTSTTLVG
jgi:hypothetical protein